MLQMPFYIQKKAKDPVTESTSPGITLLFNARSYEKNARSMPGIMSLRIGGDVL
jgi:hypothetical protein